ncbi:hypothetical protein, partial [Pseudotabrizicola alkalilacus]|uniref:hypothetical protein n=1 Tax=Pseudotabrizicola alkalilacus TaxID=2305252 RepID=UPI00338D7135
RYPRHLGFGKQDHLAHGSTPCGAASESVSCPTRKKINGSRAYLMLPRNLLTGLFDHWTVPELRECINPVAMPIKPSSILSAPGRQGGRDVVGQDQEPHHPL